MVEYRGTWSEDDVYEFLEEASIPIRLAVRRPNGTPWVVTLWYRYRDGYLECATSANAHLVDFLEYDPDVAFDVSTNDIPYRGIRGHGTASLEPDVDKGLLRGLLKRYLGGTNTPLAEKLLDDDRDEVRIRIEPHVVYSWDYTNRMRPEARA